MNAGMPLPTEYAEKRSRIMRAVKSRDTRPELAVRRLVHSMGYRYRLRRRDLPGKPDLVFSSRRKIIFVNGCFWHQHDCKNGARIPKSNTDYWIPKLRRNRERDENNLAHLHAQGWDVQIIWECETRDAINLKQRLYAFLSEAQ